MEQYSVLMSVYYKEKPEYLRQSIESMLCQTARTDDFVLVCDGPLTPELDAVIDAFDKKNPGLFQIVRLAENGGLGPALNAGLSFCKNDLVARMDSDDIAFPDRCARQLKAFLQTHADIVSGTVIEFDVSPEQETARRVLPAQHDDIVRFARRRNPFNHPCVTFRKAKAEAVGSYQPFSLCEDYFLWVRMLQAGAHGYNIVEPLLYMRAGKGMYRRRAGFSYLKTMLTFRWQLKKMGFSRWSDFIMSSAAQTVSTLIPNSLRRAFYRRFLRES